MSILSLSPQELTTFKRSSVQFHKYSIDLIQHMSHLGCKAIWTWGKVAKKLLLGIPGTPSQPELSSRHSYFTYSLLLKKKGSPKRECMRLLVGMHYASILHWTNTVTCTENMSNLHHNDTSVCYNIKIFTAHPSLYVTDTICNWLKVMTLPCTYFFCEFISISSFLQNANQHRQSFQLGC